ncbi:hypothetical protein PHMEG_00021395 [Phytophthora megakarya]|uniref:Uncharacterized protein n=1 Tax=Phytophthora megakarya TaxID=4795 RepID=A0A225VLB5_9STRA|nr:hypothetical protein PHMEG_00021395 [Phytophthora megakarya]
MQIQGYPSGWVRDSDTSCRPDGDLLLRDVDAAREMLKPFPVIWKQLRLDVRALILYGINYEGALEWLGEDRPVHGCFHQSSRLEIRMMFWNELDVTPWTKYAPRRYYVAARAKLDSLLENDEQPDLWGPLIPVLEDTIDTTDLIPEQADPTDQNWTNDGEEGDNDDEDDSLDGSPSESTRAKTKRRRIAPAEMKNPAKRQHQRKTCTMLTLKELLTVDEMMIIEVPRNDKVRSWVHFGVRMKWCDKSLNSPFGQTPGFPSYTSNRHDLDILQRRFADYFDEYREILREAPWQDICYIFHKRSAMTPTAQGALDAWVEYMCESMRHQWEMLHWNPQCWRSLVAASKKRCIQQGVPATVFEWEVSVWDIPHRVCHWIIMDKSQIDPVTQSPYPLHEQLQRLDKAEPARLQWTNCGSVVEQIAHLPEAVRKKILPKAEWGSISEDI